MLVFDQQQETDNELALLQMPLSGNIFFIWDYSHIIKWTVTVVQIVKDNTTFFYYYY